MKHLITALFSFLLISILCVSAAFSQGTHKPVALGSTGAPYGYYEYLPKDFQKTGKKFPLLVFFHGAGEKGNGKSDLGRAVKFGPGREINSGKHFPFVILSPQTSGWWNTHDLDKFIDHAIQNYNIDPNRVYLTGLSMGAMGIYQYCAKHADKVAGVVAIAGSGRTEDVCNYSSVPLWAFHGDQDHVVPVTGSMNIVNTYNKCNPKPAKEAVLTILPGQKHWGWNEVYNGSKGDIYGWLLKHSKDGVVPAPAPEPKPQPNVAPVANAGQDKVVTLPISEVSFYGSASDKDGRIASFSWTKVNGPAVDMHGANTANLSLKNLREGTYVFRFTAKDNAGASASDEVQLKVNPAPAKQEEPISKNVAVIANAGSDRTLTLPVEKETLLGSAKWENCAVQSYKWEKLKGPSVKMHGAGTANLLITNLEEGEYEFRFTATSRNGVSDSDEVKIKVVKGQIAEDKKEEKPAADGGQAKPEPVSGTVQGLSYSYFEFDPKKPWSKLPDLKNIQPKKKGTVRGFSVSPRERSDYFAFAYEGYLKIDKSGRYAFYTHTDDGSKLYLNDKLVVNNDRPGDNLEYAWVDLNSGYNKIRVEYFENAGNERLYISYKGPGVTLQAIPENKLSAKAGGIIPVPASVDPASGKGNGLSYAYFENNDGRKRWYRLPAFETLKAVKTGTVADFSLSVAQRSSHFALLFEGKIYIEKTGDYTFFTNSDDGSQLFIDGKLVVENDGWHAPRERAGKLRLSAGYHDIRVTFYEHEGGEVLDVKWTGPGIAKQTIPSRVLYQKDGAGKAGATMVSARTESLKSLDADFAAPAELRVYPNPARSNLNIDLGSLADENVSVSITDLTGKRFYQKSFSTGAQEGLQLDLEAIGLQKGVYVVMIENQQSEMVKAIRFLKE